jgi:lysozyme
MNISDRGVASIKMFEGCNRKGDLHYAYQCSAGVWTCGWGSTGGVTAGTIWTEDQASARLCQDLLHFENAVRKAVTVPLSQCQYDALVSFTFNLGEGNLRKSTLLRLLNAKDYEGAAAQFPRWDWVNGQPNAGVRRRRLAEQAIFLTGTYPRQW